MNQAFELTEMFLLIFIHPNSPIQLKFQLTEI